METLKNIITNIDNANIHTSEIIFIVVVMAVIIGSSLLFGKLNNSKK